MYTKEQQEKINKFRNLIDEADYVVVGAGAGLSASGGLNYVDEEVFARLYTPFLKKGYRTIWQGITENWSVNERNKLEYWAYWATHINNIVYRHGQLDIYKDLFELIKGKEHFVITTNGDDQFFKGNFDKDRIFAMQGNYKYFQCSQPCTQEVYYNKKMVEQMLQNMDEENLTIKEEDVPRCPRCGKLLVPNLRVDNTFVEKPHLKNINGYYDFLEKAKDKKLLLVELGVGFNTPVIIRYPFEKMTKAFSEAKLVRMNFSHWQVPTEIEEKSITFNEDIKEIVRELI